MVKAHSSDTSSWVRQRPSAGTARLGDSPGQPDNQSCVIGEGRMFLVLHGGGLDMAGSTRVCDALVVDSSCVLKTIEQHEQPGWRVYCCC